MLLKKILNFPLLVVSVLLIHTSCTEEWLEPKPLSFYAPENVYVDENGLRAILPTLRKDLKREVYENQHWFMLEFASSDLAVSGDQPDYANLTPSGSMYKYLSMFSDIYEFIKNTNVLISRIDDVEWKDAQTRNAILSEAYFFRSYWYYRLVHSYGDVPWVGQEYGGAKLDFNTHSRWAILDKIQSDMEFAVEWLPEQPSMGVPSKYAGHHLLTKIYLANSNFDKAIESASTIINGPFALMDTRFGSTASDPSRNVLWDLHRVENKNLPQNTETIFTTIDRFEAPDEARSIGLYAARNYVPHWWSFPDSRGTAGVSSQSPQADTLGQGNHDVNANYFHSHGIWAEFGYDWETTPDLRRADVNWIEMEEITYADPQSPNFGEPVNQKYLASLADTNYMWRSYPFYKTFMPPELGRPTGRAVGGNGDWYIFRLAETYLLRAEAYYWKDQLSMAAADINKVRERAKAALISPDMVTIDYIFHERARELYMEEPRHSEMVRVANIMARGNLNGYSLANFHEKNWYYDRVIRFNNWYETPKYSRRGGQQANISPFNVYWPIPQSVVTANTLGVINQNLGYQGAENNVPPLETTE